VGDRDPLVEGASPQTLLPEGGERTLGASASLFPRGPADEPRDEVNTRTDTLCFFFFFFFFFYFFLLVAILFLGGI